MNLLTDDSVFRVLDGALKRLSGDAATLAIPDACRTELGLSVLLAGSDEVDHVDVKAGGTCCDTVIAEGRVVAVMAANLCCACFTCSFMKAEEMSGYLGAPVPSDSGGPLAALAVHTADERIWSKQELDEIRQIGIMASETLRSMEFAHTVTPLRTARIH